MRYLIIIFLPLFRFLRIALMGRLLGREGSNILRCSTLILTFLLSCILFYDVTICHNVYNVKTTTWFDIGLLKIEWGFLFDSLTGIMLIVVSFISTLVHVYSTEYMKEDPHLPRFMSYLSLFTFFMLILVRSDNFVQLFLGWEGVGLASYLLINFWYRRLQANKSAIKAMIVNRIGDFGLSLALFAIFYVFKSLNFGVVFTSANAISNRTVFFLGYDINRLEVISTLLFIGAVGKSAQLGLHTWLPDAMEGPTPVSALIHAATMVTAGVFLLIRCSPLIELAPFSLTIITIVGGITAFFAATVGMLQNDLKRVIAYSTCSQLGYMVFACGLSAYSASIFHLTNHAIFKALLFLGAGSVIHGIGDEQDMRRMGGLINLLPFTYSAMLIGSLSLMGFPFLTGFYSKDFILEIACSIYIIKREFVYWLGTLSAFFTAFYSIRLIYLTFLSLPNLNRQIVKKVHEPSLSMSVPLLLLSIGRVFIGYIFRDAFIGIGRDFWNASIFRIYESQRATDSEFLPFYLKLIPVIFSLLGALSRFFLYSGGKNHLNNLKLQTNIIYIYKFLSKRWYFDVVYNNFITINLLNFGYKISFKILDRGFIEYIGPYGTVMLIKKIAKNTLKVQRGLIFHYLYLIIMSIIIFILLFVIYNSFYIPTRFFVIIIILILKTLLKNITI